MGDHRIVALIPLRGGSKGIPGKNIRPIAGKPLCWWVLKAACDCREIDGVYVSTDSAEIAGVVHGFGLPVTIIDRPAELATDTASTEAAMLHALKEIRCENLVTIQATSPLLEAKDLSGAIVLCRNKGYESLVTGVETKRFFWRPDGTPLNYDPQKRPRRQDFNGSVMENGAFYITSRSILEQTGCRLGGQIGVYVMPPESAAEIDEPEDWGVVEKLLQKRPAGLNEKIARIRFLFCDVDGTLTDAGMYYSARGEELKKFNTRDAMGLSLLRKKKIEVGICTRENSEIVQARCRKLKIDHCYVNIQDKKEFMAAFSRNHGVSLNDIAFIGDDLNDVEVMTMVGFSACPADAADAVKEVADYICRAAGGQGAVREVVEMGWIAA